MLASSHFIVSNMQAHPSKIAEDVYDCPALTDLNAECGTPWGGRRSDTYN